MLFNSVQFFVFLGITLTLFYILQGRARRVLLLVASYLFYMSWNWRFIPLLLTLTIIDYFCALWIVRTKAGKYRQTICPAASAETLRSWNAP